MNNMIQKIWDETWKYFSVKFRKYRLLAIHSQNLLKSMKHQKRSRRLLFIHRNEVLDLMLVILGISLTLSISNCVMILDLRLRNFIEHSFPYFIYMTLILLTHFHLWIKFSTTTVDKLTVFNIFWVLLFTIVLTSLTALMAVDRSSIDLAISEAGIKCSLNGANTTDKKVDFLKVFGYKIKFFFAGASILAFISIVSSKMKTFNIRSKKRDIELQNDFRILFLVLCFAGVFIESYLGQFLLSSFSGITTVLFLIFTVSESNLNDSTFETNFEI